MNKKIVIGLAIIAAFMMLAISFAATQEGADADYQYTVIEDSGLYIAPAILSDNSDEPIIITDYGTVALADGTITLTMSEAYFHKNAVATDGFWMGVAFASVDTAKTLYYAWDKTGATAPTSATTEANEGNVLVYEQTQYNGVAFYVAPGNGDSLNADSEYYVALKIGAVGNLINYTVKVVVTKYIATTENGLKAAVAAGGNVSLTADISPTSPINIASGKTVTLDLGGKTIASSSTGKALNNFGTLTLQNGTISGPDTSYSVVKNFAGATLTINDLTVTGNPDTSGYIAVKQDDQVSEGGAVGTGGSITINSGTFTAGQAVQAWGTVIINGGTFNGRVTAWGYPGDNAGEVTINGGTFNAPIETYTWYSGSAAPTNTPNITINGGNFGSSSISLIHRDQGTIAAPTTPMYIFVKSGVSISSAASCYIPGNTGAKYYATLQDALAAAAANDTIELLADCTYAAPEKTAFASVPLTVNGNNKKITMSATLVNLTSNTTFNNVSFVANNIENNLFDIATSNAVNVTFDGCSFSGNAQQAAEMNFIQAPGYDSLDFKGTLTVNDCTFDNSGANLNRDIRVVLTGVGTVFVTDCTFSSLGNDDGWPVKITGGKYADCTMTGNKLSNGNQLYSVVAGSALVLTADAPVAKIGDVGYATLADALAAAIADNTVELIANVTIDADLTIPANVTLSVEENVTLTITGTLTAIGDFTVGGSAIVSGTLALTSATGDELTTFADGFIVFDKDATFTIGGGVVIGEKITLTANSTLTLATDEGGNYQWALAGIANVPDGKTIELDEGGLFVVTDKSTLTVVGTADFVNGSVEVCGTIDVSGTLKVSIDKLDNENGVLVFQAGSLVNGEATIIGNDAGAYVKTDAKTKVTISGTIGILQNELFVSTMAIDAKEGASAVTIKDMAADSLFIGIVSSGNNTVDVTMAGDVGAVALIISEGSSLTTGENAGENDLTVYELLTVNGTLDSLADVTLEDEASIIVGDEGTVIIDADPYVGVGSSIEIPSGEFVSLKPNELGGYLITVDKAEFTGGEVVANDTIVVVKELKVKGEMLLSGTILVSGDAVLNMTSVGSIVLNEAATPIVQVLEDGALDVKFVYEDGDNAATVTFEGVKAGPEGIKICIGSLSISGTYSDNGVGKITFTGDSGKISGNVDTGVSIIVGTPGGAAATVTVVEGITFESGSTVNFTGTSQMVAAEGTVATIVYEAGTTVVQNGTTRVVEVDEQYEVDPQGHLREFIYVFFTGVNCTISVDFVRAYQGDNLADVINSKGVFAIADKPAISIWDGWYTQAGMKLTENTVVPSASTTVTAVYELDMSGYTGHDDDMPVPEKTTTDNGIDVNLLFIIAVVVLLVAIAGLILIIIRK